MAKLLALVGSAAFCRITTGQLRYCMVSSGIAWSAQVLHGQLRYCMVSSSLPMVGRALPHNGLPYPFQKALH
ncbi:hypothetical protein M3J09_007076 [Ascochyta lentis]